MSWKRSLIDLVLGGAAQKSGTPPDSPDSIFVLRNNDIGDLLVVTPLFEALRRRFPQARVVAGIGPWNRPILEGNPYVDEVIELNAPWHNKYVRRQGPLWAMGYILFGAEARALRRRAFSIGIDVLGSPQGSLLLSRVRIPYRLGVKGYAGGHQIAHQSILFDPTEHVSQGALKFAQLLGATDLPQPTPQLFLNPAELAEGEQLWHILNPDQDRPRLLLGPGAGLPEKRWPVSKWQHLLRLLETEGRWQLVLVGPKEEASLVERISSNCLSAANLAGQLTLRQTLAVVAKADAVICHSSMLLHAAAAWHKPTVALLGTAFPCPEAHAHQWGYSHCRMLGAVHSSEVLNALPELSATPPFSQQVARSASG